MEQTRQNLPVTSNTFSKKAFNNTCLKPFLSNLEPTQSFVLITSAQWSGSTLSGDLTHKHNLHYTDSHINRQVTAKKHNKAFSDASLISFIKLDAGVPSGVINAKVQMDG